MLSISRAKNAKSGEMYFEADSYYAKKNHQGVWIGKYVSELGLTPNIKREQFVSILNAFDSGGNTLVKNASDKKRKSYVDFTFSCPKSVSVLSYCDERIEQAHNAAVSKALKELESRYAITREGAGGTQSYRTGNILAARFNHHESRELEPQLHSHCVVMNLTRGRDKKWRTLFMGDMYKNQMYLGQVYRNELANELKTLGYGIDVTDRSKGLFEISGIGNEIVDEFSTRRKQVLESKQKYENLSVSDAKKLELACLDSRKYKSESDVEEIRQITQKKLQEYGTSLEQLKADALRISGQNNDSQVISISDCLKMALEDITEHESAFKKEAVLTLALKNGLGQYTPEEMLIEFDNYEEVFKLGSKDILIGKSIAPDVEYYTTNEIKKIELGIIQSAERLSGKSSSYVSIDNVKKIIQEREKKGTQYSPGQKSAIEMMCTSKNFLNLIQGDAGAGKTFAVETFREIMNEAGFTVRGFAPTGKAAVELQSAKIATSTIDSFMLSKKEDVGENEIWVVDESGMMGSRKLNRFLEEAEKLKAKVILIGDSKQFTAVEQGKMFADLQQLPGTGYAEITEVRRQKTEHMKEIVSDLKNKKVYDAMHKMQKSGNVLKITDREKRIATAADGYLRDREAQKETIVLTATNKDRSDLNQAIRQTLLKKGMINEGFDFRTLHNAGISGSYRRYADSYKVGQHIFFQKECEGFKQGLEAEITGLDTKQNSITISYIDKETGENSTSSLNLFKAASYIQAFTVQTRNFGVGDSIISLKNDKKLGLENGKIGTVKNIEVTGTVEVLFSRKQYQTKKSIYREDLNKRWITAILKSSINAIPEKTEARVCGVDNNKKSIYIEYKDNSGRVIQESINQADFEKVDFFTDTRSQFNFNEYAYCDHAYAVTTYKSQGATLDSCHWVHDPNNTTNFNEAYVAVTRARLDAIVYTGDTEKLMEQSSKMQAKESVIDWHSIKNANIIPQDSGRKYESKEISSSSLNV
ncbi:MAG: relaxase domain-containing protein [Fibrobacter sp.]|nr:relaxase domain-containing protein [Fibrobacter sp.]